ncbi:hypothetical protein K438DRAFT_1862783 [Mycena galopus ATCC 62051]|nr:hypothetical protein K438DRAFT_1862783 [Mycena galopus ATCC 62051]
MARRLAPRHRAPPLRPGSCGFSESAGEYTLRGARAAAQTDHDSAGADGRRTVSSESLSRIFQYFNICSLLVRWVVPPSPRGRKDAHAHEPSPSPHVLVSPSSHPAIDPSVRPPPLSSLHLLPSHPAPLPFVALRPTSLPSPPSPPLSPSLSFLLPLPLFPRLAFPSFAPPHHYTVPLLPAVHASRLAPPRRGRSGTRTQWK